MVNQATASTSTCTTTHEKISLYRVDSDSDNDECMKSYLDEVMPPSVIFSSKEAKHSTENNGGSAAASAEAYEANAQAQQKPLVKTQTLRNSTMGLKNDGNTTKSQAQSNTSDTKIPGRDGLHRADMSFGSGVVLDSDSCEIQSNTLDTSDQRLGEDSEGIEKFQTSKSKLAGHASAVKDRGLPEDGTNEDDVDLMDTEESQADDVRPPKRRSIRRPMDDDSTDDEDDLSQPVFSTKEASADCEVSSTKEDVDTKFKTSVANVQDELISDDIASHDSQSVMTQSESQGILGKSILDTVATDVESLLPSQVLSESELPSHMSTTGALSSKTKSTAKRGAESLTVDVDSDDSQHMKRKRSEAAERAAAAAERRQQWLTRGREKREASSSR